MGNVMRVLDADPDLGSALPPEVFAVASRHALAEVKEIPVGEWDPSTCYDGSHPLVGLLLVDGLLTRDMSFAGRMSSELMGAGDLSLPYDVPANQYVTMSGSKTGWNVTVAGDTTAGKSAVFKQYCPNATCGTDSGPGYITGGFTLAASSLTLNSTGASWTGNSGTTPSHLCNSGCLMDTTTAVKIASASTSVSLGTWSTTGYSATSLALSVPTTTRFLSQSGEVYHLDLVWTLNSGP